MNRRATVVAVLAAVALVAVWYFLLWKPRSNALNDASARRRAAEGQAQQLQTELNRLRAEAKDEPLRRAELEALRTAIPDDPNLAQLILDVNDAASVSGIDFISIAPAVPVAASTGTAAAAPATSPAEMKVSLQIQGGYFQVLDFLNRLDDMPRLVVTDSLNVGGGGGRLGVNLAVRAFTRAVPAAFGGPVSSSTTTTTSPSGGAPTTTTTVRP